MSKLSENFILFICTLLLICIVYQGNLKEQIELKEIEVNKIEYELKMSKEQIKNQQKINNELGSIYNAELDSKIREVEELKRIKLPEVSRGNINRDLYTVTCYDLSVQSTGKKAGDNGYGITATGFNLQGHTWETARTIAVDKNKIPLNSKVRVTFTNENYSKYNGIYFARDTGGAIKQNKIDFFLGDYNQVEAHQEVWNFGKTQAYVEIVE